MYISAVGVLFLLVGSLGQSGDFTGTQDDEEQEMRTSMDFSCFSKIRMYNSTLTCNVLLEPFGSKGNVYFNICADGKCERRKTHETDNIKVGSFSQNVCLSSRTHQDCRHYDLFKIAVPDPPSLSIHYNNATEDYVFDIVAPYVDNEYLKDMLIHEAVLRKRGAEWPVCENEAVSHGEYKMCFSNDQIRVPKRNLEYATEYQARVRSKPNGDFFDGFWSHWSGQFHFETIENDNGNENENDDNEGEQLLIVILTCSALVLVFILVTIVTKVLWKDRLKPLIWPELPDHKNALEKLCISPTKYIQISFNPDIFDNYHINKVDYMKTHVRAEDNLQVSATDTQLENKFDPNGCTNSSSPAVGSKESSPLMSHAGQCSDPSDPMAANGTHEANSPEKPTNPENDLLPSSDCSSTCIIPNDSPETPGAGTETFPAYSCAVKQPNNGLRELCWEDISMYIAMSAFNTRNCAIKPSHNI